MSRPTILVADDETHILNVLAMKLQNGGFEVLTAEDGAEALRLALAERPDLVITDYQMPHLSGLELCSRLHSNPATRGTPAILLTARGFSIEGEATSRNIRCIVTKPFSPREVLARVREMLESSRTEVSAST